MENKQVEKEVERELECLVDVILDVVPSIKEVRVFGSYVAGGWKPQTSDIDIFVESDNILYSAFIPPLFNFGQRNAVQEELANRIAEEDFKYLIEVHWFSSRDVRRLSMRNQGRGSLGRNMKAGRLLYPQPELFYEKIDLGKTIPKSVLLYK